MGRVYVVMNVLLHDRVVQKMLFEYLVRIQLISIHHSVSLLSDQIIHVLIYHLCHSIEEATV